MFERTIRHFRLAVRLLGRSPLFTATAVLSLAIGIGANATIFTIANGLLLLPAKGVADPDRLVDIGRSTHGEGFDTVSYATYQDVRDRTGVVTGVFACHLEPRALSLGSAEGAERIYGQQVSANYFDVLGARAALGGFFHGADEQLGVPLRRVVLAHAFWRHRFNADPAIVGREIVLNGDRFAVAAVAAPEFTGTSILTVDLWLPITAYGTAMISESTLRGRQNNSFLMGARLRPGVTGAQAQSAVDAVFAQLQHEYPDLYRDRALVVLPASRLPGLGAIFVAPFLAVLMAVVGLVLLVACTNLAGLMLARAASRSREIAVRIALGATRGDLVRQLLAESLVVFAAGGVAGLALARVMKAALLAFLPALPFPLTLELPIDVRVVAFTGLLALATGILTGLVPALQSARADLVPDLKTDAGAPRRQRLRHAFIAAQVALCLVLIVMAGLFVRALGAAMAVNPGFDIEPIEVATIDLSIGGYAEDDRPRVAMQLRDQFAAATRVDAVAVGAVLPLEGSALGFGNIRRPGQPADEQNDADWNIISPEFLPALGVPIVRGRNFTSADTTARGRVMVVNERLAHRLWPDRDPIGQVVETGDFRPGQDLTRWTVVGVARNAKYQWLGEDDKNFIYVPLGQQSVREVHFFFRRRAGDQDAPLTPMIRQTLKTFNANLPLVRVQRLRDVASVGLLPQRLAASVAGSLGLVALLLAGIGIYGVMAFSVARRTREIGVRMALGADHRRVMRLILSQGLKLVGTGALVGLAAALGLTRVLSGLLFGISPLDPWAFGATIAALLLVTLAATYAPARRAATADPVTALRSE
jgi:putative ABC transport system permease protein